MHTLVVFLSILGIVAVYLKFVHFLGRFLGFGDRKRPK